MPTCTSTDQKKELQQSWSQQQNISLLLQEDEGKTKNSTS